MPGTQVNDVRYQRSTRVLGTFRAYNLSHQIACICGEVLIVMK